MASNETAKQGGLRPARRTIVKGAAWAVPAIAIAAPAAHAATSVPIIVTPIPGAACKYGGGSCDDWFQAYRFTFCFTNGSDAAITVSLTSLLLPNGSATPIPATVTVPANTANYCVYVHGDDQGNSSNGAGTLSYQYTYDGEQISGSIATGANNLPPCENCEPKPDGTNQIGTNQITVPELKGLTFDAATAALEELGLVVDDASPTARLRSRSADGTEMIVASAMIVASTSPAAGTKVEAGTPVKLVLAEASTDDSTSTDEEEPAADGDGGTQPTDGDGGTQPTDGDGGTQPTEGGDDGSAQPTGDDGSAQPTGGDDGTPPADSGN